jgi:hypothetical protein
MLLRLGNNKYRHDFVGETALKVATWKTEMKVGG